MPDVLTGLSGGYIKEADFENGLIARICGRSKKLSEKGLRWR